MPGSGGGTGLRRAAGQHGCPAVPGPGHQAAASCWPSSRSPELLRRCNPPPVAGATVRTALPTHLARGSNSVPQAPACPPPLQAAPPRWEAHTEGSLPRCPRSPAVQRPASRVHAATGSRPHSPLATHRRTALASLARRPPNRAPSARRRDWGSRTPAAPRSCLSRWSTHLQVARHSARDAGTLLAAGVCRGSATTAPSQHAGLPAPGGCAGAACKHTLLPRANCPACPRPPTPRGTVWAAVRADGPSHPHPQLGRGTG